MPAISRELRALRAVEQAHRELAQRVRELGDFYDDLADAPDGAVPAWDLVALKLDEGDEALAAVKSARGDS